MRRAIGGSALGVLLALLGCGGGPEGAAEIDRSTSPICSPIFGCNPQDPPPPPPSWHPLTIIPHQITPDGWGIFGTGNPGPDAYGCQRGTGSRSDCIRFTSNSTNAADQFANELAFPNLTGDNVSPYQSQVQIAVDLAQYSPSECAKIPANLAGIRFRVSAYSHDTTSNTVNRVSFGFTEDTPAFVHDFTGPMGPTQNDQAQWITHTFTTRSDGSPIPKSAICSPVAWSCVTPNDPSIHCTPGSRYDFGFEVVPDDFPNAFAGVNVDPNDWIAVGSIAIEVFY